MTITEQAVKSLPDVTDVRARRSQIWVVVAAAVPSALYLLYVFHYAVNVPFVDDWSFVPLVSSATHGHMEMGALWRQLNESREVTGRLVFIAFGFIDALDERGVMLYSAVLTICTYVLVLLMFRSYLGKQLTALPVLVLGIVWFSLVDWESALWATNLNGYLTVFFVILGMYLLLVPRNHRRLSFGLGVAAAVLASLSFIEGFLLWPLGLICLLWGFKKSKTELATWVVAAVVTTVAYFHGYNSTNPACTAGAARCSLLYGVTHPDRLIHYFVLLVGNSLPMSTTGIESHLWVHDLQGAIVLSAAILVLVQTLRERRVDRNPLPLLLIVFALAFDLVIAVGRLGAALETAVAPINSRYSMPNLILLVGIVIYAWAHVPNVKATSVLQRVGFGALMAFLAVQFVVGTAVGITNGRQFHEGNVNSARIMVNLDRVPGSERPCYINVALWPGWGYKHISWYRLAKIYHLSVFQRESALHYRAEGLPRLVAPSRAVFSAEVPMATVCPSS